MTDALLMDRLAVLRRDGERRSVAGDPRGDADRARAQRAASKVLDLTYGTCDGCGLGIGAAALAADLSAVRCDGCSRGPGPAAV